MTDPLVTLHLVAEERTVPLCALAAALRLPLPTVRVAVEYLVRAADDAGGERGKGGEGNGTFTFQNKVPERSERSSTSAPAPAPASSIPANTVTAQRLVEALDDPASLPYFERLVREHSAEVLSRALAATLRVPPERLRKSRGAYFVSVLRALSRTKPTPYA